MTSRVEDEDSGERFDELTARFLADPAVSVGTGFGTTPGLRVRGKIFAMLAKGELVVKLPRARVDQIVTSGGGARFDPGHGRLMKEWVTNSPRPGADWAEFAAEALAFVDGRSGDRLG